MTRRIHALPLGMKVGGARETSETLRRLVGEFAPAEETLAIRIRRLRDQAKEGVKHQLGPQGTNKMRQLLGRPPIQSGERLRVEVVDDESLPNPGMRPLILTTNPSSHLLLADDPVEQVLAESSGSYLSARSLIIDRYYDVV